MVNLLQNQLNIIGNNIYLARHAQGLTMQEVADKTGLCRQTISDIEAGNMATGIGAYMRVAETVGVSIESNILPQVLYRAPKKVNILDKCRGITKTGIPFTVKVSAAGRERDDIVFSYSGNHYRIPFEHSEPGQTTKGKTLYMFAAAAVVDRAILKIKLGKLTEGFKSDTSFDTEHEFTFTARGKNG